MLKIAGTGLFFEPNPYKIGKDQPYGQRNEKMVRRIGTDDQFSGHEGMQIPAGFGAAENEFTRSVGHKSNRGNAPPVDFQVALAVRPDVSLERNAFAGNKIYGVAVQQETVRHIRAVEPQTYRVALVYEDTRRRIAEALGADVDVSRLGGLWQQGQSQRNQHGKLETENYQDKRFFETHF